ncbi:MAG: AAA family ATPase, partial [Candidatus Methanomethylophilaceae archaeon]
MRTDHDDSKMSLEERIALLPKGSIAKKTVKGHIYHYRRWTENGIRKEKYIPKDELDLISAQVEMRKRLERELKSVNFGSKESSNEEDPFRLNIIKGDELRNIADMAATYLKRDCFDTIREYIHGIRTEKVLILFGLRRTGKTTLMRQALLDLDEEDFRKAALIVIDEGDTIHDLNRDLITLRNLGYRFIFIDEVTLADNFVEASSILSDRFAAGGMRIVMSGTDSLGFLFAEDDALYDRCEMVHTTHIPYREFERVLKITGIDRYIEYGGTMKPSGINYNKPNSKNITGQYVDSAIARNIQHALGQYQYGGHFGNLRELYDAGELTNIINRIVEDMNHRFAIDVLTKEFASNDYALARNNMLRDGSFDETAIDDVDVRKMTDELKMILDILDGPERRIDLDEAHVREIEEYLKLLDVVSDIAVVNPFGRSKESTRSVITQPGLRYSQADALVKSLMKDESMQKLGKEECERIERRIRDSIRGRMMEDIVLFET